MGVPAFFRWLANRYPCVMLDLLEGRAGLIDHTNSLVKETRAIRAVGKSTIYLLIATASCTLLIPRINTQPKSSKCGQIHERLVAVRLPNLVYLDARPAREDESTARAWVLFGKRS